MQKVEIFRRIDLFGPDIRLLVKGQQTYRTSLGALMTLILCALLAYSCNSFILEMNKGKNAILNSKQALLEDNEGYDFNSSQFTFAVGMLDNTGQPIPNTDERKIFWISFYYCNKSLEGLNCDYIPSVICGEKIKEVSLQMNVPESYENITYCMDEEYIKNKSAIRLQGSERQDNFTMLGALVLKCQNSTDFQQCAPEDEITSYIKNANLYYSYSSFEFNKELDAAPYEQVQSLEITPLYEKVRKYIKIYFHFSESQLEYNPFYWFPNFVKFFGAEYDQTIVDQALNFDDDGSLAQIEISLNAKKKLQFITYQTLMDVAAKIGGFFTILKVFFDIILYPLQTILYRLYLINFFTRQNKSMTNTNDSPTNKIPECLTFWKLIKSRSSREYFYNQSQIIEKLLDITEVLFNPLRLTRQVEDIYGSIKRFDAGGGKLTTIQIHQAIDELVANNDAADLRSLSPRTVNQEIRLGSLTNFQIPQIQIR